MARPVITVLAAAAIVAIAVALVLAQVAGPSLPAGGAIRLDARAAAATVGAAQGHDAVPAPEVPIAPVGVGARGDDDHDDDPPGGDPDDDSGDDPGEGSGSSSGDAASG